MNVDVTLVDSAATGAAFLLDNGTTIDANGSGQVTFEITGNEGTQQFTFAEGTQVSAVVTAINTFSEALWSECLARRRRRRPIRFHRLRYRSVRPGPSAVRQRWFELRVRNSRLVPRSTTSRTSASTPR